MSFLDRRETKKRRKKRRKKNTGNEKFFKTFLFYVAMNCEVVEKRPWVAEEAA